MKEIVIKDEYIARISDEDYEKCSKIKWKLTHDKYAQGLFNGKLISMHHFILGKPEDDMVVDHINRDRLDNQRDNLRFATNSQNNQNVPKRDGRAYIGTHYNDKRKHWRVYCKGLYFGCFNNEIDAAKQFDKAAYILFGKHAQTNNLVEFQEVNGLTIEDLYTPLKRQMPKNISLYKKKYDVKIAYNNKQYVKYGLSTLEEAEAVLEEFKNMIQKIKDEKDIEANNLEIVRNKDGIAIIKYKNKEILVDDNLWHNFNKQFWYITEGGYVRKAIDKTSISMHEVIIGKPPKNMVIDHINHNRLDNRTENLRIVNKNINAHNREKSQTTSSQYIGVSKNKDRWEVHIRYEHKRNYYGSFKCELEAAYVYNEKAKELYGEYANLNKNLPPLIKEEEIENLVAKLAIS